MKYIGVLILSVIFSTNACFCLAVAQSRSLLHSVAYNLNQTESPVLKKEITAQFSLKYAANKLEKARETISGTVTDANTGDPLVGVNILVVGTSNGTVTNIDGHYNLNVSSLQDTLRFSYIGYKTRIIPVNGRTTINISLETAVTDLEQLVVTGFGTQTKRENLTSSVSTISSKEIENKPVTSTDALLQGRSAGVQVVSTSGNPGSGMRIKIRGTSSITGGSAPLYVIDGVPVQTGSYGLDTGGGTTNAMAYLNPDNIASITVLKDASATAIYGARAANGVVIIKTKRGNNGPMKIRFSAYGGLQKAVKTPNLVTGPQFEMLQNEAARNNGIPEPYANPENAVNTNWADYVFKTGSIRKYNLAISGGNKNVKYSVSGGHFRNIGTMRPLKFRRSTGQLNLDLKPSEKLTLSTSISVSKDHRNRANNNDNISGTLAAAYFFPPNLAPLQPDGDYTHFSIFENPIAAVKAIQYGMNTNRFIGNIYAKYDFTPNLYAKLSESYDYMVIREKRYNSTESNGGVAVNGSALLSNANLRSWTSKLTVNYVKDVKENHFAVLLGGSLEDTEFERATANGQQFPSDAFKFLNAAAVNSATSTGFSHGLASYFGRLQYNYAQRYLLTLTLRRDASSRFGKNNKWGTFPSAGLGWNINKESFFNVDWISQLKIRATWGITGNQSGIGNYQALGLWGGGNYVDNPGTVTQQLANPDLKWEKTRQVDIGMDIGLINQRISLTVDYYNKLTTDLLLSVPVPPSSGYQTLVQNYGELSNKGFEFNIKATMIQQKNISWSASFNIAHNQNLIKKLASPFDIYNRDIYRYKEGIPMFSFYFHKQLGVDPNTGAPVFKDVNGDGKFTINGDRTIVGNANPDFFGGIRSDLNVYQFDLSIFWNYSYGNEELYWDEFFQQHGGTRNTGFLASQLKRWQKPGDHTMIPKMTRENYRAGLRPSRFLHDGSYLRLKNVTLSYNLARNLSKNLGISNFRVYVTGKNLLTFTSYPGLDPELNALATTHLAKGIEFYTAPHSKVFMFGFDVSF